MKMDSFLESLIFSNIKLFQLLLTNMLQHGLKIRVMFTICLYILGAIL